MKQRWFSASDITAWLIIVGCFLLLILGVDGEVKVLLAAAGGWAFRKPLKNSAVTIRNKINSGGKE